MKIRLSAIAAAVLAAGLLVGPTGASSLAETPTFPSQMFVSTAVARFPPSIQLFEMSPSELYGTATGGKLKWRSWSARRATARGVEEVNLCHPDCAAGHYGYYPVDIELYDAHRLGGHLIFTRIGLRYTGARPPKGYGLTRFRITETDGQYFDS